MNLKCNINNITYNLVVQGNTISSELNETLDSGSIIIAHVKKIKNLKPYDDVYIFDNEFKGFDENGKDLGGNKFFKHLLIDNYTEEFINLKDKVYKYKISLMSEIKYLEKVQCPNISITQSLNDSKKISIYEYLNRFVRMYSPKIKVKLKLDNTYTYKRKYKIDSSLEKIFGNAYCPDFSLNAPSLRDILNKLMIVKDMVPYVENNVIKALDITLRKNKISLEDLPCTNIIGSMRSQEYCDGLRRNYTDALSQNSTCTSVEYLGFRNSDTSLMTLQNMRLETRFPIYKINKMYMCYFKKSPIIKSTIDSNGEETKTTYHHLCKQDITKLIKLNTERNALSQDWDSFNDEPPRSIDEMAQYKLCTLGYDIGSKYITGFGESYTYPKGWWMDGKKTYLENILMRVDASNKFGIYNIDYLSENIEGKEDLKIGSEEVNSDIFKTIVTPFSLDVEKELTKSALDMKGIFYEIEYEGFYNGAVIHSKDNGIDNIITNDNSSSSLSLIELDGLHQKEKVNRLGNKTYQFSIRYDSYDDLSMILNLGDYFSNEEENDIIIYHREIAIYDNYIIATYFASKDYVLKNYFTTVYARHRTWNLIPYNESITRAENRKVFLYLSKKYKYNEVENVLRFKNMDYKTLLSCFTQSEYDGVFERKKEEKINCGYIGYNNEKYLSDANIMLCGYSIVMNLKMFDNISMGTYISKPSPFYNKVYGADKWENKDRDFFDARQDYTGSNISIWKTIDDDETGSIDKFEIAFMHYNYNNDFNTKLEIFDKNKIIKLYEDKLLLLPKFEFSTEGKNIIYANDEGNQIEIYKDNKETIDMTYQIEPFTDDSSILFSSNFMKLNEFLGNNDKIDWERTLTFDKNNTSNFHYLNGKINMEILNDTLATNSGGINVYIPKLFLFINPIEEQYFKEFKAIYPNDDIDFKFPERILEYSSLKDSSVIVTTSNMYLVYLKIKFIKLINVNDIYDVDGNFEKTELKVLVEQTLGYRHSSLDTYLEQVTQEEYIFINNNSINNDVKGWYDSVKEHYPIQDKKAYLLNLWNIHTKIDGEDVEYNGNYATSNDVFLLSNGKYYNQYAPEFNWTSNKLEWDVKLEKTLYKNMFIVLSSNELKNTLIYDSYVLSQFPSDSSVLRNKSLTNYFELKDDNGVYLVIHKRKLLNDVIVLNNEPDFSYFDNKNWTENETFKTLTYNLFFKSNGIEFTQVELIYYFTSNQYQFRAKKKDSSDFTLIYAINLNHWVSLDYRNIELTDNTGTQNQNSPEMLEWLSLNRIEVKSIQYWYCPQSDNKEPTRKLDFVFGVNVDKDDGDDIKVFTSLISNRDPRVYDENNVLIGKVHKYEENEKDKYTTYAQMCDIIE